MEKLEFDELEEVEQNINLSEEKEEPKEYEKLLQVENNRKLCAKAINLVEYGCFNQKEETIIDFTKYSRLSIKKYKGKYDVYQNIDTLSIVLICPLTEDNRDEDGNKRAVNPYAYDCIYVEDMDDETYEKVRVAARNNLFSSIDICYKAGFISYFVLLAITVFTFIGCLIGYLDGGWNFYFSLVNALQLSSPLLAADVIALPLLVLASIKYKKLKK